MSLLLLAVSFLRLDPAVITDCQNGLGRAVARWSTTDAAAVTVLADGAAFTGLEAAQGTAVTDHWVRDGMRFTLRGPTGATLATTTARVQCAVLPIWPLAVGNEWTYRVNSRQQTGEYLKWRVVRREGDSFVLSSGTREVRWRVDSDGALWRNDTRLTLRPGSAVTLPAGTFANTESYTNIEALLREEGVLERGVGLVSLASILVAGSSGGIFETWSLVEAKIGDRVIKRDTYGVSLAIDPEVRNCAVPCYFIACGFVPGADPAGTVKPCQEARTEGAERLIVNAADGTKVLDVPAAGVTFTRLPLWLWQPGRYTVQALGAAGAATSEITVVP